MEALLMGRRAAGVVVLAVVLFAASFAIARAGRPEAEPAAAQAGPAEPLQVVTVQQRVGDLRKLPAASLPKLARTLEPTPEAVTPSDPGPSSEPGPATEPAPDAGPAPAPAPAPGPAPAPEPAPAPDPQPPPGGGGCDPC